MKFKIDENLPTEVLSDLRTAGHEADSLPDEGLAGAPDPVVLDTVQREGRILMTLDKGIADIRTYPPERYAGIVLFRPHTSGRGEVLTFVRQRLATILQMDLTGHLLIVSERNIRVR